MAVPPVFVHGRARLWCATLWLVAVCVVLFGRATMTRCTSSPPTALSPRPLVVRGALGPRDLASRQVDDDEFVHCNTTILTTTAEDGLRLKVMEARSP